MDLEMKGECPFNYDGRSRLVVGTGRIGSYMATPPKRGNGAEGVATCTYKMGRSPNFIFELSILALIPSLEYQWKYALFIFLRHVLHSHKDFVKLKDILNCKVFLTIK